ncbi:MAG: isoprenylcysteine carboxylmethyltransferase family protein [Proteobacteria bacterium]|nr:isoprenylcysteine carboxylmethyltransferase family protein [Pseudomonadota bacterium]
MSLAHEHAERPAGFAGIAAFAYAGLTYVFFFGTFVYAIGFIAGVPLLPKTIDTGPQTPVVMAVLINVLLLGLLVGRTFEPPSFKTPGLYKHVRHPIYLGFVIAFWSAPHMTLGHLLFAIGGTGYILVGIFLEERDLVAHFGQKYREYQMRVPMLLPFGGKRG